MLDNTWVNNISLQMNLEIIKFQEIIEIFKVLNTI